MRVVKVRPLPCRVWYIPVKIPGSPNHAWPKRKKPYPAGCPIFFLAENDLKALSPRANFMV